MYFLSKHYVKTLEIFYQYPRYAAHMLDCKHCLNLSGAAVEITFKTSRNYHLRNLVYPTFTCTGPERQLFENFWIGNTCCLLLNLVGTHVLNQNLNQFMNMEQSSWNFRTVKQLVTQNVRINFCPYKPEIQNSETMINLAGLVL